MSEFQKSTFQVLVAGTTAGSYQPTGTFSDLNDFIANAADLELAMFDAAGGAVGSGDSFFFVLKNAKEATGYIRSELIDPAKISSARYADFVAGTNQVSYIGYNGTSGSFDTPAGGAGLLYQANFMIPEYGSHSANDFAIRQGHYQAAAADGQVEVANGLTQSIVWNMSRDADTIMRPHRITSSTTATPAAGAIVPTLGQKVVSVTTALTVAIPAVGDYLGITVSVNGSNVITFYKVTAINNVNGGTITLDTEFQGPTGSVAFGALRVVTAANAALGNWGIALVGGDKKFVLGKMELGKMKFTTTLIDMGTTTLTDKATVAYVGNGDGRRVQELEWAGQGNERDLYRTGEPYLFDEVINAVATASYDVVAFNYFSETESEFVNSRSPRQLYVAVEESEASLKADLTAAGII
jgi:hypothetical protein